MNTVWVLQAASESNALAREWVDRYVKTALLALPDVIDHEGE